MLACTTHSEDFGRKLAVNNLFLNQFGILGLPEAASFYTF